MEQNEKIIPWLILNNIQSITPAVFYKLLDFFGAPENILNSDKKKLLQVPDIKEATIDAILNSKDNQDISKQISILEKKSIKVITIQDKEYPINLKSIFLPPPVLYVLGELKEIDRIALAVVGARKVTSYGETVTKKLCRELICSGITIVSGMARGVDTFAHRTTLDCAGRTIAVLGCGIDVIYPPENKGLYNDLSEKGVIISEFPLGTRPEKFNFPRRNRIISGLSLGTLVIEAGEKSGSLITAHFALEEGREVFAMPGNATNIQSLGSNALIKRGEAKLVQNADDILDELIPIVSSIGKEITKKTVESKENVTITLEEEKILFILSDEEQIHIDKIISYAKENNLQNIFSLLLCLELKGKIKQLSGKNFLKL